MNERDIAKYAALVAAGIYTEDMLLDVLGDENVVNQILAVAGATAVTAAASDVINTTVDAAIDVVDVFNPLKW